MMESKDTGIVLRRKGDGLVASVDGAEEQPARAVWARPVSHRGGELSILDPEGHELAFLSSLDELDADSRAVAQAALDERYLIPKITQVYKAEANFGNRFWDVETDLGRRTFMMRDPAANAIPVTDDRLLIKDTMGNRYEIPSLAALSDASRALVDRVL